MLRIGLGPALQEIARRRAARGCKPGPKLLYLNQLKHLMGIHRTTLPWTACLLWLAGHAVSLPAAQLEPRQESEYPHACEFKGGKVAVDYLRRSLPTPLGTQLIPGTLIFKIAAHPSAGNTFEFPLNNFQLDWKKVDWPQQPVHAQYVVASLMRPEFSGGDRGLVVMVGSGHGWPGESGGVTISDEPRNQRFPGDRRGGGPLPETVPAGPRVTKTPPHPDLLPSRIIEVYALGRQPIDHPSAGYVYFAYNGKLTKLRQLKLTIHQGEESCELLIRK